MIFYQSREFFLGSQIYGDDSLILSSIYFRQHTVWDWAPNKILNYYQRAGLVVLMFFSFLIHVSQFGLLMIAV